MLVSGGGDADATGLSDAFEPGGDIDTIAEYVIALYQDITKVDSDPVQHTPILWDALVAFGHHRLHGDRAFDRIDDRGKLKQHAISRGLHEAAAVLCHQSVGDLAVFTEGASGTDLIEGP